VQCPQNTAWTSVTFGICTLLYLAPHLEHSKIRFQRTADLTEYAAFGLGRKSYSLPIRLDHHRRMAARRGRAVPPLLKKWA